MVTRNSITIIIIFFLSIHDLSAQIQITKASRLAWDQPAPSLVDAKEYIYVIYIDDMIKNNLEDVICSGEMSPFSCNAKMPRFNKSGIHTLQVATIGLAETEKSNIVTIQVATFSPPINLSIISLLLPSCLLSNI